MLASVFLLTFFTLILYDMVKLFYRSFKGIYDNFIDRLAEKIRKIADERLHVTLE